MSEEELEDFKRKRDECRQAYDNYLLILAYEQEQLDKENVAEQFL